MTAAQDQCIHNWHYLCLLPSDSLMTFLLELTVTLPLSFCLTTSFSYSIVTSIFFDVIMKIIILTIQIFTKFSVLWIGCIIATESYKLLQFFSFNLHMNGNYGYFNVGPIFKYFMLFNFNLTFIFNYIEVKVADSKYRLNRREQKVRLNAHGQCDHKSY